LNLAPLTSAETESAARLRTNVEALATGIGGRSYAIPGSLAKTVQYLEEELRSLGYSPQRHAYTASGTTFENIEAILPGTSDPESIVVVGGHYDTAGGLPGANDNGSGVAATLELARLFAQSPQPATIRWLFFVNEEPPWFQTPGMGSYAYAKRCHERKEKIRGMLSLETIGYYCSDPGCQQYPAGFALGFPNRGDFLGFVADVRSAAFLRRVVGAFRGATTLPSEAAAAPASIAGVGWSDHWSFWEFGYPALMVTDTAPFRYPWYHTAQDTPEKLDYERIARAVTGFSAVVKDLAAK
jgi:Zn-dependent M28 family amino/carboxypeptidase